MVAHLVGLKLLLLGNALRRSAWQIVGLVVALLYALSVLSLVLTGLGLLARRDPGLVSMVVVVGGAVVVLGWWLVPLVAFGVDSTVSPERLRVFALRRRDLVLGLSAVGVVGVPGLLTVLLTFGSVVAWRGSPGAVLAALVCAPLAVATCVVGSRTWTTLLAPLRASRRFRESSGLLLLVPLVLVVPLVGWFSAEASADRLSLERVADVLAWSPPGAVWAVPAAVQDGRPLAAAGHLAVALATLAMLVLVWSWSLDRLLTAPPRTGGAERRSRGLGLFSVVPGTVTGAVVARCLTYWVRDPRYVGSLAVVPFLPVLALVLDPGDGWTLMVLAPLTAFLLGWVISADVAYDHTAFWLHVSSGVSGRADRAGRVIAAGIVGAPVTVALCLGAGWWSGRWADLPALAGMSLGVLLSALGLSSVVSARFVYPVPRPGDGPFSTPQGSAVANLVIQTGGWLTLCVLVLPEMVLGVVAVVGGRTDVGWWALAVGLGLGTACLLGGIRWGGRLYDSRSAELLQQVVAVD